MTDEHAPVKFRAGISPSSAIDAGRIAASRCEAFFGDQPYQITTLEVQTLSTLSGGVIAYEGYVEAVALGNYDDGLGA